MLNPIPPKPKSIIAQVAGSGTAFRTVPPAPNRSTCEIPLFLKYKFKSIVPDVIGLAL